MDQISPNYFDADPKSLAYPDTVISGLEIIKGVVTHKKKPGERKSVKYYGTRVVQ